MRNAGGQDFLPVIFFCGKKNAEGVQGALEAAAAGGAADRAACQAGGMRETGREESDSGRHGDSGKTKKARPRPRPVRFLRGDTYQRETRRTPMSFRRQ